MRRVGEGDKLGVEVGLNGSLLLGEFLLLCLEVGCASLEGLGLVALALLEENAYLLGDAVLLGLDGVGFLL